MAKQIPQTSFTSKCDGRVNVLMTPVLVTNSLAPGDNATLQCNAIWDTGATASVVSKRVAAQLGLMPIGTIKVGTAGGITDTVQYIVDFVLPNNLRITQVRVTEGDLNGADALIGMDIIGIGDFSVTEENAKTVFSFHFPHGENCIDYAKYTYNPVPVAGKQGRNDLCDCGSGKKFKNCCGKNI